MGAPFWSHVWGSWERIGKKIGHYISNDQKVGLTKQVKYLRIRVAIPIDKPLRKGGGGGLLPSFWMWESLGSLKVWKITVFLLRRGVLGYEECSCLEKNPREETPQFGEWLRARSWGRPWGARAKTSKQNDDRSPSEEEVGRKSALMNPNSDKENTNNVVLGGHRPNPKVNWWWQEGQRLGTMTHRLGVWDVNQGKVPNESKHPELRAVTDWDI